MLLCCLWQLTRHVWHTCSNSHLYRHSYIILIFIYDILLRVIDPYVKVVITYNDTIVHKWKTTVKHQTLAPVYNESFNCKVTEEMSNEMDKLAISFYVIDFDYVLRNDIMGVVNIGKNVDTTLGRRHWHQVLQSPRQGISFWHPIQLATNAQKRHMRSRSPSPLPQ